MGIPKNSSFNEIKNAYRKAVIKEHPKNHNNSKESQERFIEINKAFQDLSTPRKREIYDNWQNFEVMPSMAHSVFEDFYKSRPFEIAHEEDFFKPILKKKWSFGLDKMMNEEDNFGKLHDNGEVWKESTVYSNDNGVESKKHVKVARKAINGKVS